MEEEGDDEVDLARPRSGAREPKEEFPRPLSQVKPPILPPQVIDVVTFFTFTHVLDHNILNPTSQIIILYALVDIGTYAFRYIGGLIRGCS